jgi:hypothetical protein
MFVVGSHGELEEPRPRDLLLTQYGRPALVETDPGGTRFARFVSIVAAMPHRRGHLCGHRPSPVTSVIGVLYGRIPVGAGDQFLTAEA